MFFKAFVIAIFFSLMILLASHMYSWQNPDVNLNYTLTIHQTIYNGPHKTLRINSCGTIFEINYVDNSPLEAINPYFPSIHIIGTADYTAWLHVIRTDSNDSTLKVFIDAGKEIYPFYTLDKNFYDAPHWRYSLFQKPVSFWKGHAWAVIVNNKVKKIKCIGGIEWGFELPFFSLYPKMIIPNALSRKNWDNDKKFLEKNLHEYEITYEE
jgi:hypothetical protein